MPHKTDMRSLRVCCRLGASSTQMAASSVRSALSPRHADLMSSQAKSEPPASTSNIFRGADHVRPNVSAGGAKKPPLGLAKIPGHLVSGSDIVLRLSDLGSIPSFRFSLVSRLHVVLSPRARLGINVMGTVPSPLPSPPLLP